MRVLLVFLLLAGVVSVRAQQLISLSGKVQNEQGQALENVTVRVQGESLVTVTNKSGNFKFRLPGKPVFTVSFSLTGYLPQVIKISTEGQDKTFKFVTLKRDIKELQQVEIASGTKRRVGMTRINGGLLESLPSVSGNFESILKTLPGVSSNNELSSQYSVRGGNFDENLVYINDIEIYRPLLVRNGQQEGLSFINPEMVSQANFAAGGFEARYGDKLSSVLDIRYNRPDSAGLVISGGLLGASATLKMPGKTNHLLLGIRSKTNQSILKNQPVVGSYQPRFYDAQGLFQQDFGRKLSLSVFGDYNFSSFTLIPESRETMFGTINQQFRLKVDYEGQERDRYEAVTGALTLAYKPHSDFYFKWITSAFNISEQEHFDIDGSYIFDELETEYSNANFGNVRAHRGIGSELNYGRNRLNAQIYSSELRSYWQKDKSYLEAGLRLQYNRIEDKLNEYSVIDSAGYTLPYSSGPLLVTGLTNSFNNLTSRIATAFVQDTYTFSPEVSVCAGLRSNYNSTTGQLLLSPRFSLLYRHSSKTSYTLALGSYNQPPFYRELRNFNGELNPEARAQRSIHFLAGSDHFFGGLGTKLKFSTEFYFKKLNELVPYKLENLRVRYFSDQHAKGYAAGADFSLNGEFVKGLESSFRLSLMKTAEDIAGDVELRKDDAGNLSRIEPGYLKRPTDQRVNFSAFFQDRLFNSPTYKVHLTLLYGSSLPSGPPNSPRYADDFKIPSYKRVDLGFSKNFLEGATGKKLRPLGKYFDSLIAYAEVFNLLNINNTVSFLWIKDVNNNHFAIPNYLTSRQISFKIIAKIKNR